jgi:hypothetical protein
MKCRKSSSQSKPLLAHRMRSFFPIEGGILTLWSASAVIGLFFLIKNNLFVGVLEYLIGSLFFLSSVQTVKKFITFWIRRTEIHLYLIVPLLLGFLTWSLRLSNIDSVIVFALFMSLLAFAALQVMRDRERNWETRVAFTGGVSMMSLLGLFSSGAQYGGAEIIFVFMIPFTFFSTQELFVQHIAETRKVQNYRNNSNFRSGADNRRIVLYFFLITYSVASLATARFTSSIIFPIVFEFLLIPYPIIWLHSQRSRFSFRRLGLELASLDLMLVVTIGLFVTVI